MSKAGLLVLLRSWLALLVLRLARRWPTRSLALLGRRLPAKPLHCCLTRLRLAHVCSVRVRLARLALVRTFLALPVFLVFLALRRCLPDSLPLVRLARLRRFPLAWLARLASSRGQSQEWAALFREARKVPARHLGKLLGLALRRQTWLKRRCLALEAGWPRPTQRLALAKIFVMWALAVVARSVRVSLRPSVQWKAP